MSDKDQSRRRTLTRLEQIRLSGSAPNLKTFFAGAQKRNNNMVMLPANEGTDDYGDRLRRGNSFRSPSNGDEERGIPLRRGGSLNFKRKSNKHIADTNDNDLREPVDDIDIPLHRHRNNNNETNYKTSSTTCLRAAAYCAPVLSAPAPEYLAISLLQLGCPLISMPRPRGGVGLDNLPTQSSDSDDSTTSHHPLQHHHLHHQQTQQLQQQQQNALLQNPIEGYGLPKVQVSAPTSSAESPGTNESAGSIDARSAPTTPQYQTQYQISPTIECGQQSQQEKQQPQQHSISGTQLAVSSNSNNLPPPSRSPSHISLQKCSDSHLSKPLSRSTPSMVASGGISPTPISISRSSIRSSTTSTNSGRQKKFHRHFSQCDKFHDQVAPDERVLNYYSCALVGNMLLQGHLYITPNYFAFYSNVFGYVTKLLIPTTSVLKISKEKTARIIPNAIAIATEDERHVFGSLLSRDSTFKLMKQVWDAAIEGRKAADNLPLPVDVKLLAAESLLVDDLEGNPEEDDSSMSESGTDISSRPPTICTDTDALTPSLPRPILSSSKLDHKLTPKHSSASEVGLIGSLLKYQIKPATMIAILIALLAALYISAALMMIRIDKLHTAYLNHPLSSPEKLTQNRLLHYLNTNLDQIGKVRQSLQALSQQFVAMNQENEAEHSVPPSSGSVEPDDAPR